MRFKFRLQKVKDAKGTVLDVKRAELARATAALRREEGELASIDQEAQRTEKNIGDRWQKPVSVDEMEVCVGYFFNLKARRCSQVQRVKAASELVNRKRQETLGARREVKILENLFDRQHALFTAEEARKAQIELDDIGARFHQR